MATESTSRVLVFVIFTLQGGGAERFVLTMAKEYAQQGYSPHVILFKNHIDYDIPAGLHIHLFPFYLFRWIPHGLRRKIVARLLDWFILRRIGKPIAVLSNLFVIDQYTSLSRFKRVIHIIHNTPSQEFKDDLAQQTPKQNVLDIYHDRPCICVGQGVMDDFVRLVPKATPISAIYNPIDIDSIRVQSTQYEPLESDYIVHIGSFKHAKRHDLLLKAYAHSQLNLPLVLLGKGPLLDEMKQLAAELGIASRVIFKGFTSNPYPYLRQANLMVISSDYEGFSIAILEGLALGTPIISTDCPSGPNEILAPHQLTPCNDISRMATLMSQATLNPQNFKTPLSEHFMAPYATKAYLEFIQKL